MAGGRHHAGELLALGQQGQVGQAFDVGGGAQAGVVAVPGEGRARAEQDAGEQAAAHVEGGAGPARRVRRGGEVITVPGVTAVVFEDVVPETEARRRLAGQHRLLVSGQARCGVPRACRDIVTRAVLSWLFTKRSLARTARRCSVSTPSAAASRWAR